MPSTFQNSSPSWGQLNRSGVTRSSLVWQRGQMNNSCLMVRQALLLPRHRRFPVNA